MLPLLSVALQASEQRFGGALHCRSVQIAASLKSKDGAGPKLKDFKSYVDNNDVPEIKQLKAEVEKFAMDFPTIGFEKATMRYKQ